MSKSKKCPRRERISQAMETFYNISGLTLETALSTIRTIENDLIAVLPDLQAESDDYRLGNASYGYDGNEEGLLLTLQYVSDRWGCAFRVAWVLGLVNQDYR